MSTSPDAARQMLRHTVATVAYRGGKVLRGAPESFAGFTAGATARTPAQILGHLGDLFAWALSMARGQQEWKEAPAGAWNADVARFHATLQAFDDYLASDAPLQAPAEKLFQGPVADALTHVGQIAILRRLAGCAIRGENYFQAEIVSGRVGAQQAAARREFD
ncbi:MAG: hypothetical protein LAN61_08495 [Acidobacteriia bacterium]|nr:hypothetical protein [Terriglobia bacterium]